MLASGAGTNNCTAGVDRTAKVFEEHGSFIRATIRSKTSGQIEEDDIFQDVFVALVRAPVPDDVQDVKSYLYRVIIHDIFDAMRRKAVYRAKLTRYADTLRETGSDEGPERALISREELGKVLGLVESCLPRSEFEAVRLRYADNQDNKEIAAGMGLQSRTVRQYIHRGLRRARQILTAQRRE